VCRESGKEKKKEEEQVVVVVVELFSGTRVWIAVDEARWLYIPPHASNSTELPESM
jgi:hypothetical protein